MLNYEITFIVDPVLSNDEINATAQTYEEMLTDEGCEIVYKNEMGLKQLAYPIKKRTSGVYYCIEFQSQDGTIIPKAELAFTRDERIMRFLTVRLDKYGVKYNQDKRDGKIGTVKKRAEKTEKSDKKTLRSEGKAKAPKTEAKASKTEAKAVPAAAAVASSEEE